MQKSAKSPFFAKFLENQIENDNKIVGGGNGNGKTSPKFDTVQTMKYPSDSEDTGDNYTMKYPSDSEDTGSDM